MRNLFTTTFVVFIALFATAPLRGGQISNQALQHTIRSTVFIKVACDFGFDMADWSSCGSGFFVDPGGYVMTNFHVVEDEFDIPLRDGSTMHLEAESRKITLVINSGTEDEREVSATVVATDKETDLALLKTDYRPSDYLDVLSGASLTLASQVWAIGFPLGGLLSADKFNYADSNSNPEVSLSSGMVASLRRDSDRNLKFVQTDAAVNPGNSGGPLVNENGELAGVITYIMSNSEGLNFAIAPNRVRDFLLRHTAKTEFLPARAVNPNETIKVSSRMIFPGLEAAGGTVRIEGRDITPVETELLFANGGFEGELTVGDRLPGEKRPRSYRAEMSLVDSEGRLIAKRKFRLPTSAQTVRAKATPTPKPTAAPKPKPKKKASGLAGLAGSVKLKKSVIDNHQVGVDKGDATDYTLYENLKDEAVRQHAIDYDWLTARIPDKEKELRRLKQSYLFAASEIKTCRDELDTLKARRVRAINALNKAHACRCADGSWHLKPNVPCSLCTVSREMPR